MKTRLATGTAAFALVASLFCAAAHANQSPADAPLQQAASATQASIVSHQAAKPQGLTRKQVYDALVKAEKDGSLAKINALYEGS
jgi:hypothetical protein